MAATPDARSAGDRYSAAREGDGGPLVRLWGVVRRFQEGDVVHTVLNGADARIEPGEVVALLGPSGSGKSTLLNLIAGIDLPDGGDVVVAGRSIPRLSERERTLFRRRNLGFVFQFLNLLPTLTVLENLLLPLELGGKADAGGRARARALLDEVELGARAGAFPDRLSGGEQQRVALVRALVNDPILLLADEPTGNLDHATGARVMDLLERLVRGAGGTALVVTHSAEVAARADRVLVLRDGRIEEEGAWDGRQHAVRSAGAGPGRVGP